MVEYANEQFKDRNFYVSDPVGSSTKNLWLEDETGK